MRLKQAEAALDDAPNLTPLRLAKWIFIIFLFCVPGYFVLSAIGWLGSAATVVKQEVNPRTILNRYEWFIETWNAVQEQDATLDAFKAMVAKIDPSKLSRRMQDDWSLRQAEIRGLLANRNRLAREYRSAIQKINYVPATMLPYFPQTIPNYVLN